MVGHSELAWSISARWVFPVDGPPLPQGTVTVWGEHVVAVEPAGKRTADWDLGNAAIIPGLVNAHTHLDLSGLRGCCAPTADFTAWLRAMVHHRRGLTPAEIETNVRAGLAESLSFGTTLLGDISAAGLSWPVLAEYPGRSVVFYELLGLTEERAGQALADAWVWLESHPATEGCRPGLSPHAPYSVRVSLFRAVADFRPLPPVAIHLAETLAELELIRSRTGPFIPFLKDLAVWDPDGLVRDVAEVPGMFTHSDDAMLFIHANYLDAADALPPGSAVVYCPRTHAAFGHAHHPYRALQAAGGCVALGTDSLASNPDLDVLAEARFLRQLDSTVPDPTLLAMATLEGARALCCDHVTGSLTPGKSADLVVLSLPGEEPPNPYDLILRSAAPVRAVLCRGRWIHGHPGP
jgi:cytosine/adenosine deaminase-related metal-dependent hydrolase